MIPNDSVGDLGFEEHDFQSAWRQEGRWTESLLQWPNPRPSPGKFKAHAI
jgi:hypothetical protein